MSTTQNPKIGMRATLRGVECLIIAIHPMGTIDVQEIDGQKRCWRVSGLPFGKRLGASAMAIRSVTSLV